jgi:uncharacterized protein DUF1064
MKVLHVKHKFNAKKAEVDGLKFPSQAEAKKYRELKLLERAGDVLFFLMQVPFHLPGNVKYRLDFLVFYVNGEVRAIDVKGMKTPLFIAKKKLVEALYPIEIELE